MRVIAVSMLLLTAALGAYAPVQAMPGPGVAGGARSLPADPDAATERLVAATNRAPRGSGHDRPSGSRRGIIRDDHSSVSQAFSWLDNK